MAQFNLPEPQPDPLLHLVSKYHADTRHDKIDLGVGVYRDDDGNTPVLRAVKEAENRLQQLQPSKSYLGLTGDNEFVEQLGILLFGQSINHSATYAFGAQTPGGSGALRLAAEIYKIAHPKGTLWVGLPTWPNHLPLTESAGVDTATYEYFDKNSQQVLFENLLEVTDRARPGDAIILHGCCHNPTGADLTTAQWQQLVSLLTAKEIIPIVDLAYHGLGNGLEDDLAPVRLITTRCPEVLVATSCSKNFGLYRDRTGAVYMTSHEKRTATRAQAVFGQIARTIYSMPPDHGAAVVKIILQDNTLRQQWHDELSSMTARIKSLRQSIADSFPVLGFVARQKGLFSLLPLNPAQVNTLIDEHAVYLAGDGRINIAGCQEHQIERFVAALKAVDFCGTTP